MNPKIAKLVEQARARHAALRAEQQANQAQSPARSAAAPASSLESNVEPEKTQHVLSSTSNLAQTSSLSFNPEQLQAIEYGLQGKSFCLIGPAGTGKTTVTQELQESWKLAFVTCFSENIEVVLICDQLLL